jgi:hypothetical protein
MHTDSSLSVLDEVTELLGKQMRYFADVTCPQFKTVETDGEYASRGRATARREATKAAAAGPPSNPAVPNLSTQPTAPGGKRPVTFSLHTYKHHAMGYYASTIRRFGTTDSYSTQIVSNLTLALSSELTLHRENCNTASSRDGTGVLTKTMPFLRSSRWMSESQLMNECSKSSRAWYPKHREKLSSLSSLSLWKTITVSPGMSPESFISTTGSQKMRVILHSR